MTTRHVSMHFTLLTFQANTVSPRYSLFCNGRLILMTVSTFIE